MFWWLTFGFLAVWSIAVAVELLWFNPPDDEDESDAQPHQAGTALGNDISRPQRGLERGLPAKPAGVE